MVADGVDALGLALVVFATWRPERVLIGAWLFGGLTILNFAAQGRGISIPSEFLAIIPYIATILVLVLISRLVKIPLAIPASKKLRSRPFGRRFKLKASTRSTTPLNSCFSTKMSSRF